MSAHVTESTMTNTPATTTETPSSPVGKIVLALILGAGIAAFFYFDLGQYLSLDALKANRDNLLAYTEANFGAAVAIFILLY